MQAQFITTLWQQVSSYLPTRQQVNKVIMPFIWQNIGWFLSGFCFLSGSIFLVMQTAGQGRAIAVFTTLSFYTLLLVFAAYKLRRHRPELANSATMLSMLSILLLPLCLTAFTTLLSHIVSSPLGFIFASLSSVVILLASYTLLRISSGMVERHVPVQFVYVLLILMSSQILAIFLPHLSTTVVYTAVLILHSVIMLTVSWGIKQFSEQWSKRLFVERDKLVYFTIFSMVYAALISFVHIIWRAPIDFTPAYFAPFIMYTALMLLHADYVISHWVKQAVYVNYRSIIIYALSICAYLLALPNDITLIISLLSAIVLYALMVCYYLTFIPLILLMIASAHLYYLVILSHLDTQLYFLASTPFIIALYFLHRWAVKKAAVNLCRGSEYSYITLICLPLLFSLFHSDYSYIASSSLLFAGGALTAIKYSSIKFSGKYSGYGALLLCIIAAWYAPILLSVDIITRSSILLLCFAGVYSLISLLLFRFTPNQHHLVQPLLYTGVFSLLVSYVCAAISMIITGSADFFFIAHAIYAILLFIIALRLGLRSLVTFSVLLSIPFFYFLYLSIEQYLIYYPPQSMPLHISTGMIVLSAALIHFLTKKPFTAEQTELQFFNYVIICKAQARLLFSELLQKGLKITWFAVLAYCVYHLSFLNFTLSLSLLVNALTLTTALLFIRSQAILRALFSVIIIVLFWQLFNQQSLVNLVYSSVVYSGLHSIVSELIKRLTPRYHHTIASWTRINTLLLISTSGYIVYLAINTGVVLLWSQFLISSVLFFYANRYKHRWLYYSAYLGIILLGLYSLFLQLSITHVLLIASLSHAIFVYLHSLNKIEGRALQPILRILTLALYVLTPFWLLNGYTPLDPNQWLENSLMYGFMVTWSVFLTQHHSNAARLRSLLISGFVALYTITLSVLIHHNFDSLAVMAISFYFPAIVAVILALMGVFLLPWLTDKYPYYKLDIKTWTLTSLAIFYTALGLHLFNLFTGSSQLFHIYTLSIIFPLLLLTQYLLRRLPHYRFDRYLPTFVILYGATFLTVLSLLFSNRLSPVEDWIAIGFLTLLFGLHYLPSRFNRDHKLANTYSIHYGFIAFFPVQFLITIFNDTLIPLILGSVLYSGFLLTTTVQKAYIIYIKVLYALIIFMVTGGILLEESSDSLFRDLQESLFILITAAFISTQALLFWKKRQPAAQHFINPSLHCSGLLFTALIILWLSDYHAGYGLLLCALSLVIYALHKQTFFIHLSLFILSLIASLSSSFTLFMAVIWVVALFYVQYKNTNHTLTKWLFIAPLILMASRLFFADYDSFFYLSITAFFIATAISTRHILWLSMSSAALVYSLHIPWVGIGNSTTWISYLPWIALQNAGLAFLFKTTESYYRPYLNEELQKISYFMRIALHYLGQLAMALYLFASIIYAAEAKTIALLYPPLDYLAIAVILILGFIHLHRNYRTRISATSYAHIMFSYCLISLLYLRLVSFGMSALNIWDTAAALIAIYGSLIFYTRLSKTLVYNSFIVFTAYALLAIPFELTMYLSSLLFLLATAYFLLYQRTQYSLLLYISLIFSNVALYLWIPRLATETQLLHLYLIPASFSIMLLLHLHRDHIKANTLHISRLVCLAVLYSSISLDVFLRPELGLFVAVLAVSFIGIGIGIALQVRAFLYTSLCFLILNVLSQIIRFYPEGRLEKAIILMVIGTLLTLLMIWFNLKKEHIMQRIRWVRADLAEWV